MGQSSTFIRLNWRMDALKDEPDNYKEVQDQLLCRKGMSINDLREIYYSGKKMTKTQRQALGNYDRFRLAALKVNELKEAFHQRYMELQVMANLYPYKEFLKKKYTR